MPLNQIVSYCVVFIIGCIFGFSVCSCIVCAALEARGEFDNEE